MSNTTKLRAPGGVRPMNAEEFMQAKLLSLLMIVSMMQKEFFHDDSLLALNEPTDSPRHQMGEQTAKRLMERYLALLSAAHRFFPAPGELEAAARSLGLWLGIQIDIEKLDDDSLPIAPSTTTKQ